MASAPVDSSRPAWASTSVATTGNAEVGELANLGDTSVPRQLAERNSRAPLNRRRRTSAYGRNLARQAAEEFSGSLARRDTFRREAAARNSAPAWPSATNL